jgi:hypothetical protein
MSQSAPTPAAPAANTNILGILSSLSFYSPIIISAGILILSIFSAAVEKGAFYMFWVAVATALRAFIMWKFGGVLDQALPAVCRLGDVVPFGTPTYSTFILMFTAAYFIIPMVLLNNHSHGESMNYSAITFFVAYVIFDLFIKSKYGCVKIVSASSMSDLLGGFGVGSLISTLLYSSSLKNMLFINEITSNADVCAMPSKQQFKCKLYKNGELVQG